MSQETRKNPAALQEAFNPQNHGLHEHPPDMNHEFFQPGADGYTSMYQGSEHYFAPSESALSFDHLTPATSSDDHYMNSLGPMDVWQQDLQMLNSTSDPSMQQSSINTVHMPGLAVHKTSLPSPQSTSRGTPEAAAMHAKKLSQTSAYLDSPALTPLRATTYMQQPDESSHSYTQPTSAPQASPIIMFSHHTRGDSPARSDQNRQQVSKKRSASNLSQGGYFSDHEDEQKSSHLMPPGRAQENDWEEDEARDGVDPLQRNQGEIQSFADMEQQDEHERSVHITQQWLERTTLDVGAERRARTAYRPDRIRSRSTGARPDPAARPILNSEPTPGPGIEIEEESEYHYSTDTESQDSLQLEDHPETVPPEMPAQQDPATQEDHVEPLPSQFIFRRTPWRDAVASGVPQEDSRFQPDSSNAAIYKFMQQAREFDSSSRRATWGTGRIRRLSEGDAGAAAGPKTRHMSLTKSNIRERTTSIVGNILKRSNSRGRPSNFHDQPPLEKVQSPQPIDEAQTSHSPFFTRGSPPFKPKTPSITAALAGATGAVTAVAVSPTNLSVNADSHKQGFIRKTIRRVRSKSDVHKSPKSPSGSGIGSMWFQHGGPPIPTLRSPEEESNSVSHMDVAHDQSEAAPSLPRSSPVRMTLSPRPANVMPDLKGFKVQIRELNPNLGQQLVDRIAHDQVKRYKRLVKNKVEHAAAVAHGTCPSQDKCPAVGGQPDILPSKVNARDTVNSSAHFKVSSGADSDEEEAVFDGVVTPAAFPEGIPLPPAKRLPARFECPLCFQIKTFQKPSDWTKHVHEDVQPFTCTWPNCQEPKSFKRKADWVRHENERHRHLEWWECTYPECNHVCYRKDNFVQHLVREHKRREPKLKTRGTHAPKGKGRVVGLTDEEQKFWDLVENCRHEKSSDSRGEPCNFCGNILSSWKKLSVHVGKHMEQIAMPVLELAERRNVTKDTIISPVEPMQKTTYYHQDLGLAAEIHSNPLSPYTQSGGSNHPGSSATHSPYHQLQPTFAVNNTFADGFPSNTHFHQSLSPAQFDPQVIPYVNPTQPGYDMSLMYTQAQLQDQIPTTMSGHMNYTTAIDPNYMDHQQYFSSPEQPFATYGGTVTGIEGMQHITPPPTGQGYNSQVYSYPTREQQWQ